MAQQRYYEFRADDDTFTLANHLVSLLPPGRYHGFYFTRSPDWTLTLSHESPTVPGFQRLTEAGELTPPLGVLRTPQGITLEEDGPVAIPLTLESNPLPRWVLIYLEHSYKRIQGGEQAVYGFVEGVPSENPEQPSVDGLTRLRVGSLYIPGGATTLQDNGVSFTPEPTPYFGYGGRLENELASVYQQLNQRVKISGGEHEGDLTFDNLEGRDKVTAEHFITKDRGSQGNLDPGEEVREIIELDSFSSGVVSASMSGGEIEINKMALVAVTASNVVPFVQEIGGVNYNDGLITIRTINGEGASRFKRNFGKRVEIIFNNTSGSRDARYNWSLTQFGRNF